MTYNLRLSIHTLGCKLNQAESEELKKDLKKARFFVVQDGDEADVNIIRGCAVTCGASQTTREIARQAKKGGAYVIAIGCLENKNLPEIDFVARDNEEVVRHLKSKPPLLPLLLKEGAASHRLACLPLTKGERSEGVFNERTRAFIKIQNGCNFHCAYCVIPSYRGQSDSVPAIEVIKKIKEAEKEGYKEVVLTGVNIGLYRSERTAPRQARDPNLCVGTTPSEYRKGRQTSPCPLLGKEGRLPPCLPASGGVRGTGEFDLAGLLKKIIQETKIPRIRLGSLDPRLITDELLSLYCHSERPSLVISSVKREISTGNCSGDSSGESLGMTVGNPCLSPFTLRLLPHWHLSLQSGADKILKAMGRGYTAKKYEEIVKKIRARHPLFSFTTDIIVGFPGETDKDFENSVNFVKKIGFAKVHVFPYSKRPGTTAEKLPGQIQDKIKTERAKKLRETAEAAGKKFIKKFSGLTRPVLFENKKDGVFTGFTPEYLQVKRKSSKNLRNKIVEIKL